MCTTFNPTVFDSQFTTSALRYNMARLDFFTARSFASLLPKASVSMGNRNLDLRLRVSVFSQR
jgi:hypothetical protein